MFVSIMKTGTDRSIRSKRTRLDLVFLTGLQVDFDRMRQLAFFFRRDGAMSSQAAASAPCFPNSQHEFFDVVCAGGVESTAEVAADFLRGDLKTIYRSPITAKALCVDYSHFARNGINPRCISRGLAWMQFQMQFLHHAFEVGAHARYRLRTLSAAVDSAIASAPLFSFRRWYPIVLLLDNNFSDNLDHMLAVCELLRSHKKIRGWGALVTQNVIRDRELVRKLAQSKCNGLFVGLEFLDRDLLRRHNKTQNLGRGDVIDDIAFAEVAGNWNHLRLSVRSPPSVGGRHGEANSDDCASSPHAHANLHERHRSARGNQDVLGRTEGGRIGRQSQATGSRWRDARLFKIGGRSRGIVDFVERVFRRPWVVVGRLGILLKTIRRIARSGTLNPIRWFFIASANFHCFLWSRAEVCAQRTYQAGSEILDPQYLERPADLSDEDRERYFDPVQLTDASGAPSDWLKHYVIGTVARPIASRPPCAKAGASRSG